MSPNGQRYQVHENPPAEALSRMLGQMAWEKQYLLNELDYTNYGKKQVLKEAREAFRDRYGISYL